MSIVSLALRICAMRLIRGATFADDRVYDSAILPIDKMALSEKEPFIVVATEDEKAQITGRDVLAGQRTIDLVIEYAIGSKIEVRIDGTPEETISVVDTDGGLELSLALIGRQITRALIEQSSPWAVIFAKLASQIVSITSRRGGGAENGRFAARQMIWTIDPLAEPAFGQPIAADSVWGLFIAALRGDSELIEIAPLIEATIIGTEIEPWRLASTAMGLTDRDARAIGIMSAHEPSIDPPETSQITVEGLEITSIISDGDP